MTLLRVSFHGGADVTPTILLIPSLRFCADGTLRHANDRIVARCEAGLWGVHGRSHREFVCEGPVHLRMITRRGAAPVLHGPYPCLRTLNGVLYAGDHCLCVRMPGRDAADAAGFHEIALLAESGPGAVEIGSNAGKSPDYPISPAR
ncbi:MAG TPA: hypothetical protein VFS13_14165 [Steroidobacteraceae bacterium]|jgi:hypothetical protein|nr:hypothetical protein [Steroidobacteraceae bacterium]